MFIRDLARDLKKLKQLGITHIVNCASPFVKDGQETLDSKLFSVHIEHSYYREIGIFESNYLAIPVRDRTDFEISVYFERATRFIDSALNPTETASSTSKVAVPVGFGQPDSHFSRSGKTPSKDSKSPKVIVHCSMGKSRSATIVIAYLLMRAIDPFPSVEEAIRYVNSRRTIAPNDFFLMQLLQLERRLRSSRQKTSDRKSDEHSDETENRKHSADGSDRIF